VTEDVLSSLVGFGRALRTRGLPVGTGRILTFCRASIVLSPLDRGKLYWAGRTTLIGRREDIGVYDDVFEDYFARRRFDPGASAESDVMRPADEPTDEVGGEAELLAPAEEELDATDPGEERVAVRLVASRAEVLRSKSFEDLSLHERRRVAALIRALAIRAPTRPSRRLTPATKRGMFDLRRTIRSSLRTEGEPFRRAWRTRSTRMRPLVLVLDVSASMSAYSRALMQFGFAAMRTGHRVEVFCFGTRLTRVTRSLRARDPDQAMDQLAGTVRDWEGGTRIGESVKQLLDAHGQHASVRGAVVVLCSDGLDRGDPGLLATQMARLGRLAHRVVWLNPLKGGAEYQPLARGMAAALPHVDVFLAGHNLASLERLGEALVDY
jgi:uncharacterized protein with von Willebrand factor type A (vWA) domain